MEAARSRGNRVSVFPPDLPVKLDDPDAIRAHDWQAFRELTSMENHWQRPGWTPGRRSYHWMLSFHDANNVQRLAKQCQAPLSSEVFDLVPLDALHLTIGRVGFTDEVAKSTALAVAAEAGPYCRKLTPFELVVGPLAGSTGAIRFSLAPWSPLAALHRQLTTVTRAVLGEQCVMNTSHFRPHLSIAYANTTVPVTSLLSILEQLRTFPIATATVVSVVLVELRREGNAYVYDELRRIRFNSGV
jgi:2'-5' RNA ligase